MNQAEDAVGASEVVGNAEESNVDHDEEDADSWLDDEVAKLVAEEDSAPWDPDAYKPQLMDEGEMHSLRRELKTSEARIEHDGHLREFVVRRPTGPARPLTQPRARRRPTPRLVEATEGDSMEDPFVIHDGTKRDYAAVLHDEVEQLNQLQELYEETKRMLLDHLDLVCSTKPSERMNGQEVYEKLDELLALAGKCTLGEDR